MAVENEGAPSIDDKLVATCGLEKSYLVRLSVVASHGALADKGYCVVDQVLQHTLALRVIRSELPDCKL